jgi:hypothetical protein
VSVPAKRCAAAKHRLRRDILLRGVLPLWQNEFGLRMTLAGGFCLPATQFGDADMAKKLSPEEAAVMIIRRRLQQIESAKQESRRGGEPQKPRAAKPQTPKSPRAGG